MNTKLFDTDFNVVFQCDPWNGNPCTGNITIPNIAIGTYNLSAVSGICELYIPVSVEEGGDDDDGNDDTSTCQTILENWSAPDCLRYNADGSFTTNTAIDANNRSENTYSSSGELISSNTSSYAAYGLSLSADGVIVGTNAAGQNINVIIAQSIYSTYTTGNNFFDPKVAQAENGNFYIVGVEVGDPMPNQFGFTDAIINLFVHQLDADGNEINAYNFESALIQDFIGGISEDVIVKDLLPR